MKIAFINPPDTNTVVEFPGEQGEAFLEANDFGRFPPLGLLYVLSYLEKHVPGHEFFFIDCPSEKMTHDGLKARLGRIRPDVAGITSFTISLVDVILAAKSAKEANPNCHVCLGGHHPIAYPLEAVNLPNIDSIIVGEGELAFAELVTALGNAGDVAAIQGVYTRDSIKPPQYPRRDPRFSSSVIVKPAYIEDINQLPFPNRKHMKHISYGSIVGVSPRFTTLLSSRGCPYSCTFCDVPYKRYRERTPAGIVDEIEQCLELGYREFHFYDDLFNITAGKVVRFCDELDRRGLKIMWDFRGRVNGIDRAVLARAKKSGCRMISFGVETGSEEGLRVLKKGMTLREVKDAFRLCREAGILTIANYMIGLPHETSREDVLRSIDFLINEIDPDYALFNILKLYPHTEIYDQAVAKKIIIPGRWHEFARNPTKNFIIDHWLEFLPLSELVELYRLAYRKFYFRPKYILKSMLRIRTPYELAAKLRGALKLMG